MKLILLGIVAIIIVGYTAFTIFRPGQINLIRPSINKIESTEAEPIRQAKKIYADKKAAHEDFEKSPCLSEDMGDGWALDIVHNPRTVQDDQTQCPSFESGKVTHLIDMTPDGKIIRAE